MEEVFHLYSDGEKSPDLLICEKDFITAMNLIAVLSHTYSVQVLGFSIEDTHVHILLKGKSDQSVKFLKMYQKLMRRFFKTDFILEMEQVADEHYLKNVGTYVICQATKDGKRVLPMDYRWSSASLYFRTVPNDLLWKMDSEGTSIATTDMGALGTVEQRQRFRTRNRLPDSWKVCGDIILPSSYVDIKSFEAIYKTHNAFRTFCGSGKNKDYEVLDSMSEKRGFTFEEHEARVCCSELCKKMFGFADVRKLRANQRIQLARELRRIHKMGINQIARRVHLPEIEVRRYVK